jgi:hypothetical protein
VTLRVARGERAARAKPEPIHPEEPGAVVARAVTGATLESPALPALQTSVAVAELVELMELEELAVLAVLRALVVLEGWEGSTPTSPTTARIRIASRRSSNAERRLLIAGASRIATPSPRFFAAHFAQTPSIHVDSR